jgi:hypothetical protein
MEVEKIEVLTNKGSLCVSFKMTLSFLASVLFKHLHGEKPDEPTLQKLRELASQYCVEEPKAEEPNAEEPEVQETKKVRKIKTKVENALLKPVDADMEAPVEEVLSYRLRSSEIVEENCKARKEGDVVPGTEGNKVYREKQCPKKAQKDGSLCKVCARMEEQFRESKGKDKKWLGRVGEKMPDHVHMNGSTWFHQKYPDGLIDSKEEPKEEFKEVEESMFSTEEPKEVLWIPLMIDGIAAIRNVKNGNVYKANLELEGEDMIQWSDFMGKWRDGELDSTAEEDDEE